MRGATKRIAVVTDFFRAATGSPTVHSMRVLEEGLVHDGSKTYRCWTTYDVDWSEACGCYLYHQSGSGGSEPMVVSGIYHVTGDAVIEERPAEWVDAKDHPPWHSRRTRHVRKRNRTRRLSAPPRFISLEPGQDMLGWMESNGVDVDSVYCSECRSHVRGDYLCDHTWWCEKIGWYSTPSDRCGHDREECQA